MVRPILLHILRLYSCLASVDSLSFYCALWYLLEVLIAMFCFVVFLFCRVTVSKITGHQCVTKISFMWFKETSSPRGVHG